MNTYTNYIAAFLALFITVDSFCQKQTGEGKKLVTMEDYGLWRTVTSAQLSNDGKWMTFDYIKPEAGDDAPDERNLQIRHLVSDKIYQIPLGISPQFSDDSRWIACMIDVNKKVAKKARDEKKPVKRKVQLLDLETGKKLTWDNATSFAFSDNSHAIYIRKPVIKETEHSGSDVIVYDIKRELQHHLGSVSELEFNKKGSLLAYTRDAADKTGNGLYVLDLATSFRNSLDQDSATYSQLIWDEEGSALAALKGNKDMKLLQKENQLIAFTGLGSKSLRRYELDPVEYSSFPVDMIISEYGRLTWNTDASKIFFGIKEQKPVPKKRTPEEEPKSDLDIWHWKDVRIQSVQRARAGREKRFTYRAVYNLQTKKFVQLTDRTMRYIEITKDGKWGLGQDRGPYIHDYKPLKADYYRVDTETGERMLMFKALQRPLGLSPDSRHFAYWKDSHIRIYDLEEGVDRILTQQAPVSFVNQEYDYFGEKPPYGLAGWSKDGKFLILNHRYDIWLQPLNGDKAINMTDGVGAENEIRLRYIRFDREEETIDLDKPLILSAYGQWTKKSGFYRLEAGTASGKMKVKPLVFENKSIKRPVKAKYADQYMFSMESYVECPDLYVSNGTFSKPKRITDANPQQDQYLWGHMVLIDYTNKDGVRLQGALAIPDTRMEGERLPMVVGFYEKTSQYLNEYERPRYAPSSWIHLMEMVSGGYMMMYADIHFRIGSTMEDMLECVEAAVDKAVELGYADPGRIGLMGHSFSGAGAIYIAGKSKKFAAVSAGAGAVDPSGLHHLWGYSADRKTGSGQNAHSYEIYGQGRMGNLPVDDFKAYSNGAFIDHVPTMSTPLLLTQGESDDIVGWMEAIGIYNAMRFYGKEIILLSYPDEGHSLWKRTNRIDFTKRTIQFFDNYLKGKPAADWIENGVPFLEKESLATESDK